MIKRKICAADVLPWAALAAAWLFAVGLLAVYGRSYLDSDMAAEMLLADLLNREGGFLSTNWFYSTELRVVYLQLVFRVGLKLFPVSWHAARVFGQAMLLALQAAAAVYCARGAGLRRAGVWAAAASLLPYGFWNVNLITFGSFYIPHTLLLLFPLGLALRLAQSERVTPRVLRQLALLGVCALAAGLCSVRLLMNLYAPLGAAAFVLLVLRLKNTPRAQWLRPAYGQRLFAVSVYAFCAGAAGYLVNLLVLLPSHAVRNINERTLSLTDPLAFFKTIAGFFGLFGWPGDSAVLSLYADRADALPFQAMLTVLGVLLGLLLAIAAFSLLPRFAGLEDTEQAFVLLFFAILVVDGAVFAFTSGSQQANSSYWVPCAPLAFVLFGMALKGLTKENLRRGAAALCAVLLLACSALTVYRYFEVPLRGQPQLVTVTEWLEENGYEKGYASFWNSDVVTELSNGEIEMYTVENIRGLQPQEWLQETSHTDLWLDEPVFVLISPNDGLAADLSDLSYGKDGSHVVYHDDAGYYVLAFENTQELYDAMMA